MSAAAEAMVTALRDLAGQRPGEITLLDGFPDTELDGWPVRVPEAVRIVLRAVGGVTAGRQRYAFGPSGRPRVRSTTEGATWALTPRGDVLTVAGDGTAPDWGPVLSVAGVDEYAFTVEAPGFVPWLQILSSAASPREPRTTAPALSSRRPSPSPPCRPSRSPRARTAELAALVGTGHSLVDVADLRDLPGYPCAISWEPYFTYDGARRTPAAATSTTGSSAVDASCCWRATSAATSWAGPSGGTGSPTTPQPRPCPGCERWPVGSRGW
ncbi:hypothetical protein SGLAM104S_03051 [Streptomyces glaucescens]